MALADRLLSLSALTRTLYFRARCAISLSTNARSHSRGRYRLSNPIEPRTLFGLSFASMFAILSILFVYFISPLLCLRWFDFSPRLCTQGSGLKAY